MSVRILTGDCRDVLPTLDERSVNCIVTSPPYWGLRSYLPADHPDKHREIGGEPTVMEWVDTIVGVFDHCWRVLRDDGTLWLNLGDSYAGSRCGGEYPGSTLNGRQTNHARDAKRHQVFTSAQRNASAEAKAQLRTKSRRRDDHEIPRSDLRVEGCKEKDLVGQPWLVAFALRARGWYWRQVIVWHKKNPMPESATDRCTSAWEPVLLFSKSRRYYFNADAIKEPASPNTHARIAAAKGQPFGMTNWGKGDEPRRAYEPKAWDHDMGSRRTLVDGHRRQTPPPGEKPRPKAAEPGSGIRQNGSFEGSTSAAVVEWANKRNVWTLGTEPFKEAHYATFPQALVEPCILAGCPEGGTVLDPFGGSGTVGLVAERLHRHAVLIDLDPRNEPMARRRMQGLQKELLLGATA